jgi:hypothetical protein
MNKLRSLFFFCPVRFSIIGTAIAILWSFIPDTSLIASESVPATCRAYFFESSEDFSHVKNETQAGMKSDRNHGNSIEKGNSHFSGRIPGFIALSDVLSDQDSGGRTQNLATGFRVNSLIFDGGYVAASFVDGIYPAAEPARMLFLGSALIVIAAFVRKLIVTFQLNSG